MTVYHPNRPLGGKRDQHAKPSKVYFGKTLAGTTGISISGGLDRRGQDFISVNKEDVKTLIRDLTEAVNEWQD